MITIQTEVPERLFKKEGNKAKPYQVRQARNIILKYKLGDKS